MDLQVNQICNNNKRRQSGLSWDKWLKRKRSIPPRIQRYRSAKLCLVSKLSNISVSWWANVSLMTFSEYCWHLGAEYPGVDTELATLITRHVTADWLRYGGPSHSLTVVSVLTEAFSVSITVKVSSSFPEIPKFNDNQHAGCRNHKVTRAKKH